MYEGQERETDRIVIAIRSGTSELGGTVYPKAGRVREIFNRNLWRGEGRCGLSGRQRRKYSQCQSSRRPSLSLCLHAVNWIGRANDATAPLRKYRHPLVAPAMRARWFVRLVGVPIASSPISRQKGGCRRQGQRHDPHVQTIFQLLGILQVCTPVHMGFAKAPRAHRRPYRRAISSAHSHAVANRSDQRRYPVIPTPPSSAPSYRGVPFLPSGRSGEKCLSRRREDSLKWLSSTSSSAIKVAESAVYAMRKPCR